MSRKSIRRRNRQNDKAQALELAEGSEKLTSKPASKKTSKKKTAKKKTAKKKRVVL